MLVARKIEIEAPSLAPPRSHEHGFVSSRATRASDACKLGPRARARIGTMLLLPQKQATRIQFGMKLVEEPEEVQGQTCPFVLTV
jgi:hypothetical protein